MGCGLRSGAIGRSRGADSLRESPRELARNFYDARIGGDPIQDREQAFGLRKRTLFQVVFELMKRIIHAQPVVLQPLLEERKVALLLEEAFKDQRELRRRAVQGVVVIGFVYFSALFIAKCLFAEIGNPPVNIEVESGKIVQLARELENPGAYCVAHLERLGIRIFTQLPDIVARRSTFTDLDLDEFGIAALEYTTIGNGGVAGRRER